MWIEKLNLRGNTSQKCIRKFPHLKSRFQVILPLLIYYNIITFTNIISINKASEMNIKEKRSQKINFVDNSSSNTNSR